MTAFVIHCVLPGSTIIESFRALIPIALPLRIKSLLTLRSDSSSKIPAVLALYFISTSDVHAKAGINSETDIIDQKKQTIFYALDQSAFSDYTTKTRLIELPRGTKVSIRDDLISYPDGTTITKVFGYWAAAESGCLEKPIKAVHFDERENLNTPSTKFCVVEKRVLTLKNGQWAPSVYEHINGHFVPVQTSKSIPVTLKSANSAIQFFYQIPSRSECYQCHEGAIAGNRALTPIGASLLHRLDTESKQKLLSIANVTGSAEVLPRQLSSEERNARQYLDINCAHCHNPNGLAAASGLNLADTVTENLHLGVCKRPVVFGRYGGRKYDIVPGRPDESVLLYRLKANDAPEKMPELGRHTSDTFGEQLIGKWIATLEGDCD